MKLSGYLLFSNDSDKSTHGGGYSTPFAAGGWWSPGFSTAGIVEESMAVPPKT